METERTKYSNQRNSRRISLATFYKLIGKDIPADIPKCKDQEELKLLHNKDVTIDPFSRFASEEMKARFNLDMTERQSKLNSQNRIGKTKIKTGNDKKILGKRTNEDRDE